MSFVDRVRNWFSPRNALEFVSLQDVRQATADVGRIGQGLDSNVVMAPVQWIMRTFTQSVPMVERRLAGRKWQPIDSHPAERLLLDPNPFYDGDALAKAEILSFALDGNSYAIKERSALGAVVRLWYVPHWMIEPKWPEDGSAFISHYEYRPVSGMVENIRAEDVIHIRDGLDPRNPRLGLSSVKAALREVMTDEEASAFSAYILANMGVPGGVISPKDVGALPSQADVDAMKEHMQEKFTGKNRGKWLVVGAPTDISQFGFDPNSLQLGPLRDISEERVCAMLGVPAAVVGFGAGLQQTKVGATMRELVRLARVNCIEPMQSTFSRQLSRQLLPDFEPDPSAVRFTYDNSGVGMFQEDHTDVAKRAVSLYEGGVAKRNESRGMVGLDPDAEDGEGYASPTAGGDDEGNQAGAGNRIRDLVADVHRNGGGS